MAKIGFENKLDVNSTRTVNAPFGASYTYDPSEVYVKLFNENFGTKEPAIGFNNFSYSELSTNSTLYNSYSIPELSVCLTKLENKNTNDVKTLSAIVKENINKHLKQKSLPESEYIKKLNESGYTIYHDEIFTVDDVPSLLNLFISSNTSQYIIFGLSDSDIFKDSICFVKPLASSIIGKDERVTFIILPMINVLSQNTNYEYQFAGEYNVYTLSITIKQLIDNSNLVIPITAFDSISQHIYN